MFTGKRKRSSTPLKYKPQPYYERFHAKKKITHRGHVRRRVYNATRYPSQAPRSFIMRGMRPSPSRALAIANARVGRRLLTPAPKRSIWEAMGGTTRSPGDQKRINAEAAQRVNYAKEVAINAGASLGAMGVVAAKFAHGGAKTLLRGSGAYHLSSKRSFARGNGPPMFKGGGKCRVSHREYLTDIHTGSLVSGSSGFAISRFDINPGLQHTFPWLSGVASLYEEHRPLGIVFEFKSTCGNAFSSTNNSLGTVIMATEYNSGFPTFTSKIQMENYKGSVSAAPTRSQYHAVECAGSQNPLTWLYTRSTDVPDGQTPQVYDLGSFQIATVGMQAAGVNIGELWVTYNFEFDKPKFSGEGAGDTALWLFSGAAVGISSPQFLFGRAPRVATGSDLGIRWGGQNPGIDYNTLYFPQKPIKTRYVLTFNYAYTAGDQKSALAGVVAEPFVETSSLGTGVTVPSNFWATAPTMYSGVGSVYSTNNYSSAYYGAIATGGTHYTTFTTNLVVDVDAFVVGNTNRLDLDVFMDDSTGFDATFVTPLGWSGSMLITTVPTGLNALTTLGVPTGPEPEPDGCESNPHSFFIPSHLRKALQVCELNEQALEGKEEKKDEPSDDEKEEEDEVVPSKRNRFSRSYTNQAINDMKALRDANRLIPDDDEPDPLPEEKKETAPSQSSLTSLLSMPPPSSSSQSSSLSTPPPGATIITPRTAKRGWFA